MCSVDGCGRPAVARGLCKRCHQNARRAAKRADTPRELQPLCVAPPREGIEIMFNVRLSEADRAALDRIARARGLTAAAAIRELIRGTV